MLDEDSMFELKKTENAILYAVVSGFNKNTYVHVRKYYNGRPTKYGINFNVADWYEFIAFLTKQPTGSASFGKVEVRMLMGGNLVANTSAQPDVSIFIRKSPIEQILKRYVTLGY